MTSRAEQDRYPLSPMQQGMLYETLACPGSGMYGIQVAYRLRGKLVPARFISAWQELVRRHPVLRTSFEWDGSGVPEQIVHAHVELPVETEDWRAFEPAERERRLTDYLERDARREFELTKPPLLRLSLIRLDEDVHELVLAHHHLLLDGWCKVLLFEELFAFYQAFLEGRKLELPLPRPYRDYIDWLGERDLSDAEQFWKKELHGFDSPTALSLWPAPEPSRVRAPERAEHRFELVGSDTDDLRSASRRHRLTLSTVVQGLWAVLLGHASGSDDVVFGATASGRPMSLTGVESMVGLFINTLPVRSRLTPEAPMASWLSALQMRQARARDYDYTPLSQIHRWCRLRGGQRLFESIVVFENNSGYGNERERFGQIQIGDVRATIRNSFPLTLRCVPGSKISFQILYDPRAFATPAVVRVGELLVALARRFSAAPTDNVQALLDLLDERQRRDRIVDMMDVEKAIVEKLKSARLKRRSYR